MAAVRQSLAGPETASKRVLSQELQPCQAWPNNCMFPEGSAVKVVESAHCHARFAWRLDEKGRCPAVPVWTLDLGKRPLKGTSVLIAAVETSQAKYLITRDKRCHSTSADQKFDHHHVHNHKNDSRNQNLGNKETCTSK